MPSQMRKQYYFRSSPRGLLAWDVDRLVRLSSAFPRNRVSLGSIRELDEVWLRPDKCPSWRALIEHMTLVQEADLSYPIIISASGEVMDGMHRVAKAVLQGLDSIEAVQFSMDPDPDHVGVEPSELPY
jgi:hypothetical protein